MAEEFASDFVLDPNRNDGYPAVDSIPDVDFGQFDMSGPQVIMYNLCDLDIYNDILENYPSYNEDIQWGIYDVTDNSNVYIYMETDLNLDPYYSYCLDGYPSFDEDVQWYPTTLTGMTEVDSYIVCDFDTHEGIMDDYFTFDNTEEWKMFGAFSNTNVTRVNIPASVKNIDNWAFYNCPNLERVKIARDCLYYENSFPPGCITEYHNE